MMTSAFKLFRPCQVFCALLLFLLSGQAWSQCGPLPSPALTANQWSLVSLPCMPTTMTVDGVWGDELGTTNYDATWVVYERDEINDSYTKLMINSPVNQDAAYWVLSLAGASWNLDGTPTPLVAGSLGCPTANCYEIPLVPPGNPGEMRYNMVGFPYPILIPWQDVHVRTDGLGVLNPSEAQALNVLSNTFWIWNGNAYEVANDVTPGMMGVLQPYAGMFVETRDGAIGQNPVLLIPESAVNDLPDAATDNLTVLEGGSQTVLDSTQTSVLDNDSDREGQPLVVMASPPAVLPTPPTNGMVTLNTPGTFQYDHDGGETTADTFDYTVCEDTAPFQCSNGTVDVVITPVNDAPALGAVGDQMIDELANLNFTATSTDPDVPADALAFSLSGVVPTGAAISPMGVFNFTPTEAQGPGSFTFDVVVMDNGVPVMSDNETITVTVNEVNVAPTVTNQTLGPVSETAADTAVVGTVAATDPDVPANTLMFSITGANPGNAFAIDGSGQITVNDTDAIDFDTPPLAGPSRFELTVEVDDGAAQPTAVVTINLTDVAPSISNTAFTIAEDIADTTVVGSVPNSGDTNGLTYSFTGGSNAGGAFAIDSDGQITVNDTSAIDFENPPLAGPARFALAVMVTDGTTADTATVTVNLTDIDEPPVLNLDDDDNGGGEPNFAATFNTSIGNPIPIVDGSLSATDPDTGAMISSATVTITNVQDMPNELLSVVASGAIVSGDISFNASTGVLTINRVAPLSDYQTVLRTLTYDNNAAAPTLSPARSITAVINDGANNSAAVTSTVTLVAGPTLDLDDDNSTAAGNNFSGAFTEGSAAAAADTDVTITAPTINLASATATLTNRLDGDANEALAATASGGILAGDITYTPATGVLSIAPAAPQLVADFEAVLESLTYNNTDDVPTETDRIIHVTVTDTNTSTSEVAVSTLSVTAVNDPPGVADKSYNATGNVQISVPDGADDLLNGATDPEGDTPITINSFQGTSANGGTVTANTTTGAFTYDPPAGFTGDDTFTYTLTDDGGTTVSGNITVTVTVADLIWFIDDNPAQTGNDGTLTNPFTTLAAFDTANGSGGTNPAVGQCIFLHSGSYTGGVTLLNNQRLLGQGSSATIQTFCSVTPATNSISLPGVSGTDPVITHTGAATDDGISLAQGNTIRGLNIGNTGGIGIDGSNVGTLTISEVAITGNGGGIRVIGSGTLNTVFDSINSTSSPAEGILLDSVMGSFTVTGPTGVTSPGAEGIEAVNVPSGQTLNFTLTGNATVNSVTSSGIRLDNTLGTLNVTVAGAGSSIQTTSGQVLHMRNVNLGAGGVNFTSLTATVTGTEDRIDLENVNNNTFNGGTVSLAGTSVAGTDGIEITGTSLSTFNFGSTTIDNTLNRGIFLSSGNGPITFTSVDIDGTGGAGIAISGNTSAVNVNGGNIGATNDPAGAGLKITGGSANITIASSITKTTSGNVASVMNRTGGTATISGSLSAMGSVANGINLQGNTGGTTTFSGGTKTMMTGANIGVNLVNNDGHTINFIGGGLDIDTTVIGFNATGGATGINVSGTGNSVDSGSATAINIVNTAIGATGVTFESVNSSGAASPGIVLNNTGTVSGSFFTVTGDGSSGGTLDGNNNGSGGAIVNKMGDAIQLTNVQNVTIRQMNIGQAGGLGNIDGNGIRANTVNGLTLANTSFRNVADQNFPDEAALFTTDPRGIWNLNNNLFSRSFDDHLLIENTGMAGTINVTNNLFEDNHISTMGNDSILYNGNVAGSNVTLDIKGNTFTNSDGEAVQIALEGSSSANVTIGGPTLATDRNNISVNAATVLGGGITLSCGSGFSGTLTYLIQNNDIQNVNAQAVNVDLCGTATAGNRYTGTIADNMIGTAGTADSAGFGIEIQTNGAGVSTTSITNNIIREWDGDHAINLQARDGAGRINATINGNSALVPSGVSSDALGIAAGLVGGDTSVVCADVDNNTLNVTPEPGGWLSDIFFFVGGSGTLILPGYVGGLQDGAAAATFLIGNQADSPSALGFAFAPAQILGTGTICP